MYLKPLRKNNLQKRTTLPSCFSACSFQVQQTMYCSVLDFFSSVSSIVSIDSSRCSLVETVIDCIVIKAKTRRYENGNGDQNAERFAAQSAIIDKVNCINKKRKYGLIREELIWTHTWDCIPVKITKIISKMKASAAAASEQGIAENQTSITQVKVRR